MPARRRTRRGSSRICCRRGITEASYTQWEFFFARAHQRRLSLYIAAAGYRPDRDAPSGDDFPELQKAFVKYIEKEGLHYTRFSNRDALRAEVLKEPWPEERRAKPILLPYPSLGSLFKGRAAFIERLRESLTRAADGGSAVVTTALYGLGGIGKTQAASDWRFPLTIRCRCSCWMCRSPIPRARICTTDWPT